jgi:hypothetical protein
MSAVRRHAALPDDLDQPTLFAAFEGWNDAGEAATGALEALAEAVDAEEVADLDPEDFFDFQVNRPIVRWEDGERVIEWPETTFSVARLDGPRDVVLLRGREPNTRWRTFTEAVLEVARELGVTRVVTIGALQVDVPHTRPVPLTGGRGSASVSSGSGSESARSSSSVTYSASSLSSDTSSPTSRSWSSASCASSDRSTSHSSSPTARSARASAAFA